MLLFPSLNKNGFVGKLIGIICFFLIFAGFVRADELAKSIGVKIPDKIQARQEINAKISLLDAQKKILVGDQRSLEIHIFNNNKEDIRKIDLVNGQADEKITFSDSGASMIQVWDPANKHLVKYSSFDVLYVPARKK